MLWVDHSSYYGPDRRAAPPRFRLHERRRENLAAPPPTLDGALRQLRLYVLEAHGAFGLTAFAERANAVAALAEVRGEFDVAEILTRLANSITRGRDDDMRVYIYEQLDRLYGAMHTLH
jgi:hypothetical protein